MSSFTKEVLFNDGEGIDFADFNALQRRLRSQLWDMATGSLARLWEVDNIGGAPNLVPSNAHLWTVGSGCYPRVKTGVARSITNAPGILAQGDGTYTDPTDTHLNATWLAADDLQTQFADNASGNPRYDIVQVKIDYLADGATNRDFKDANSLVVTSQSMNKTRSVRLTFSTKQGTPAGSPVEPTPDSGFLKWCAVLIPNGIGSGDILATNIRDYRMPVGMRVMDIMGHNLSYDTTQWSTGVTGRIDALGGVARTARAHPEGAWMSGRLLRVGMMATILGGSAATAQLVRTDFLSGGVVDNNLVTITSDLINVGGGRTYREHNPLAASNGPFWLNGYQAGLAVNQGFAPPESSSFNKLAMLFTSGTGADIVYFVRFVFAGGI